MTDKASMVTSIVSHGVSESPVALMPESSSESPAESFVTLTTLQFLKLYLNSDLPVLLPLNDLIEILTVPIGQIAPMFQMPAWVVGVYNRRGEILWVIDLNHLLGLAPWHQKTSYGSKHTIVVLKVPREGDEQESALGLLVDQVGDILSCTSEAIQSFSTQARSEVNAIQNLGSFVSEYWQSVSHEKLPILDRTLILEAMPSPIDPA